MPSKIDVSSTVEAIRALLRRGDAKNQEEICEKLEQLGHKVTQSTVSRTLKRLGAIRTIREGSWVYELPDEIGVPPIEDSFADLVTDVENNAVLVVVSCKPGAAPLIARYLDHHIASQVMGTIAGDDTIFIAPKNISDTQSLRNKIAHILRVEPA